MDLVSGRFHLTLTSLDGQGPLGEVDGTKDPGTGVVTAVLDGPGCSKLKLPPTNPYVRKADGTDLVHCPQWASGCNVYQG